MTMKRIVAFVKANMLEDVIFALHEVREFPGASISDAQGIGSGSRDHRAHIDRTPFHALPKSVRIEIVCRAQAVDEIAQTIMQAARTGLPDDGKIYVSPVEDAMRIRTGVRGDAAL